MTTFKPLRELVTLRGGGTPSKQVSEYWNGGIPWASVKDFTSTSLSETQDFISQEGLRNSSANLISKGHVIIPTRMSLGKAAINSVDLAINQDLRALVPIVPIDTQFLLHAVLSLKDEIVKRGSGATVKGITQEELYKLEIAYPPLDDQIRIARLLGKVEGLIARRKQQLAQLDALLKSVFLEMFGDPVRNEKGWDKASLEKFGSINRGVSKHRPRNDPKLLGGKHPLIQTGEVSNAGTYITTYTQTYSDIGFSQSKQWPAGTLCITIAANIAQTGILTFDACFPDSVVGFVADKDESNTLYVLGLFWFFQAILEKNAPAAAQKNINLEILRNLEVPKPPIEVQNQFAAIVEKIEALKTRYRQTLTDLETLYAALSHSAFKGEMDLSRIPLPAADLNPNPIEEGAAMSAELEVPIAFAFPDLGLPIEALTDEAGLLKLLLPWLEHCHAHLGADPFVVQDFLDAAQSRLEEIYPDGELELGMAAYQHIKTWVFESLDTSRLKQEFHAASKRITLKHAHA